jgi:hypothetical protein
MVVRGRVRDLGPASHRAERNGGHSLALHNGQPCLDERGPQVAVVVGSFADRIFTGTSHGIPSSRAEPLRSRGEGQILTM